MGQAPTSGRTRDDVRTISVRPAMAIGAGVMLGSLALVIGVVVLLWWSGAVTNRRFIAVMALGGIVLASALSARSMVGRARWSTMILAGELIPLAVVLVLMLASVPIVGPMTDFHSAAIAMGWSDAPNLGTLPTQVLHRLSEARAESGGDDTLGSARHTAIVAMGLVIAFISALVIAGALGAMHALRRSFSFSARPALLLGVLLVVSMSIGYVAWPSIWVASNAVIDFDQSAGPERGVNISEVVNHPETMWGERVVVSATIKDVLDPHSATIGNDALIVGDTLLIVGRRPLVDLMLVTTTAGLDGGDVVQVSGTVERYDPEMLESELGIGLEAARERGYDGQSLIVVDSIDPDVPASSQAGDPELMHGTTAGYDYGVTIGDIMGGSQEYLGLTVTVSGEVEETVLTPHAFVLDDQGLLAISEEAHPELFVEATAYVTGEVRMFDLVEVEQETGLDLDEDALAQFEGRPFILVESVSLLR